MNTRTHAHATIPVLAGDGIPRWTGACKSEVSISVRSPSSRQLAGSIWCVHAFRDFPDACMHSAMPRCVHAYAVSSSAHRLGSRRARIAVRGTDALVGAEPHQLHLGRVNEHHRAWRAVEGGRWGGGWRGRVKRVGVGVLVDLADGDSDGWDLGRADYTCRGGRCSVNPGVNPGVN